MRADRMVYRRPTGGSPVIWPAFPQMEAMSKSPCPLSGRMCEERTPCRPNEAGLGGARDALFYNSIICVVQRSRILPVDGLQRRG